DLGMSRFFPNPVKFWRLIRIIKQARPDVIQTWMYHANLIGGLAGKLAGVPVVWGIHHTSLDRTKDKALTIWIAKALAFLSGFLVDKIVYCSHASQDIHEELGYEVAKGVVVQNGFDLSEFRSDPEARKKIRQELGVADDEILIGSVGRFHPQKDHENIIKAAKLISQTNPNVKFVLCGADLDKGNQQLNQWLDEQGVRDRFLLFGPRSDVPDLMNALDIFSTSSAYGEAFPLVIGEAMACEVPCVVTDVGDSAEMVAETRCVVPPRDPEAMARAWHELLESDRKGLGEKARQRIQENFSIAKAANKYQAVYELLRAKKTLALFFTRGVSLRVWDQVGNLAREIRPYNELAKVFTQIYFFTYGDQGDLQFKNQLAKNIVIVPKKWPVPDLWYELLLPLACRKELRASSVLKTNQMKGGLAALIAKWLYKKPLVVRCGFEWLMFCRQLNSLWIKQRVVYWIERIMYKHADHIILSARNSKDFVMNEFGVHGDKITLIGNYVDIELFKPQDTPKEPRTICFVGRLSEQKNLFNLITALMGMDVKLVLFGSGPLRDQLQEHARQLRVNVEFRGNIENQKLPVELNKCEMFILPSLYEGNPKVLLEAMACGLPVIATDVVGNRELIHNEENGLLCQTDADSIRAAVQKLLQNKELQLIIGKQARQTIVDNFALGVVLEKETRIYDEL
ncbi:glycosyltransferase, partial [Patescibacteria group bacterium]|nr:glycosyltransferase [Patescibacteria group bacterium]